MARLDPIKQASAAKALRDSLSEVDAEDPILLADMIEGETTLFEDFDALLHRMARNGAYAAGLKILIEDMEARKRRFESRVKMDKALIEQAMLIAEITEKVERPGATLYFTNRPASVQISEESEIPAKFWKTGDPVLDRAAIAAALKAEETVPGANLSNAAPTLTIRVK